MHTRKKEGEDCVRSEWQDGVTVVRLRGDGDEELNVREKGKKILRRNATTEHARLKNIFFFVVVVVLP